MRQDVEGAAELRAPRRSPGGQLKHDPAGGPGRWRRAHTQLRITPLTRGLSSISRQLTVSVPSTSICGSEFLALTTHGSCIEFMIHGCLTRGCKAHIHRGSSGRLASTDVGTCLWSWGQPADPEGALC